MKLVDGFIHDILGEALTRNIRVRVLASDSSKLPAFLVKSIDEVEAKTQHCNAFHLNLCVRYAASTRTFILNPKANGSLVALL